MNTNAIWTGAGFPWMKPLTNEWGYLKVHATDCFA